MLLFITALLFSTVLLAQTESAVEKLKDYATNIINFNREYPQEKVYLHMDNRSYYIGDTIWFKAYVMNALSLRPTHTSGVLYVELLNENGVEMEHKKLRVEDGMCHGEFLLKSSYRTGYYEIRAYTRNMLNFGNEAPVDIENLYMESVIHGGEDVSMDEAARTARLELVDNSMEGKEEEKTKKKGDGKMYELKRGPIGKESSQSLIADYNHTVSEMPSISSGCMPAEANIFS